MSSVSPTHNSASSDVPIKAKLEKVVHLLVERGRTIAFAESMSAGYLAYQFSTVEGSGDIFLGGLVCYDSGLKTRLLQVPETLIKQFSAESLEVTLSMAEGLMNLITPNIGVALTGLCSPGGSECEEKPVGTVFVVFSQQIEEEKTTWSRRYFFNGSPEHIIEQTVASITDELIAYLMK
ncbi:MAG TPA: CinA family protein [Cellvibrionaceae bacterium]